MSWRLQDFQNYFLLWLVLLLDDGLAGRATREARIYDLGAVARFGLEAEAVRERAAEVLGRAPAVLGRWGFDPRPLESFCRRLETGVLPADEIIDLYSREASVPGVLRHFTALADGPEAEPPAPVLTCTDEPTEARQSAHREIDAGH
jgi:hypothetical protein